MSWSAIPGIYRKFETDATIAGKIWVVGSIACRYVAQYRDLLCSFTALTSSNDSVMRHNLCQEEKFFIC